MESESEVEPEKMESRFIKGSPCVAWTIERERHTPPLTLMRTPPPRSKLPEEAFPLFYSGLGLLLFLF